IPAMHEANVKRLQDWIALPSIAAENRNYPQGAEYMAKRAREAGFAGVKLIPASGKPGVFGKLDAGARTTVGIYFMYDVKQFEPSEWSSPPLEARLARREGLGTVCMGRGAVNQKGPENSFLSALLAFKAAGRKLPVNLVLVCEGEEEIASPHFQELIMTPEVLAELHKCSGVFMPEAGQDRDGGVLVSLGAKGVVELELGRFAAAARVAADHQHRRAGRRLHGSGGQDRAAAPGRCQDRHAPGAGHDRERYPRQAQGAPRQARLRRHRGQHERRLQPDA